ncbi:MAG: GerAB/ArcD/ProY family transporter [Thermaerobacter sp.]|nr:GerAB/ArcD/ProY family transporter [Thermaerobacter sp.]
MSATTANPSPLTYVLMLAASLLGPALFVWPLHVVVRAGQNALWGVLLAASWAILAAWLHSPRPNAEARADGCVQTALDSLGMILLLGIDVLMLVLLAGMLKAFFLYETPRWACIFPLLAVVMWWTGHGRSAPARITAFWLPWMLIVSLAFGSLALTNATYFRAALPSTDCRLSQVVAAAYTTAYLGVPLGLTVRRLGGTVAGGPGSRYAVFGVLLAGSILLLIYGLNLATLGPDALVHLRWPSVFTLEQVTLDSAFFISRVGIAVIFVWTLGVAMAVLMHFHLATRLWVPPHRSQRRWIVTGVMGLLVAGASNLVLSPLAATHLILHLVNPLAVAYLGIDTLAGIGHRWRTRKQPPEHARPPGHSGPGRRPPSNRPPAPVPDPRH